MFKNEKFEKKQSEKSLKIRSFIVKMLPFIANAIHSIYVIFYGLIAQWIEHPPSKRVVAGSNPAQSD